MFRRIANSMLVFFREETLAERGERMLPAAVIGALAGTAYVITLSTINIISLPALQLSPDWNRLLTNLVAYDLALALAGAIAGWFTDDHAGAIGGGIVTTLLYLLINWLIIQFTGGSAGRIVQMLITAVPLLVGAMLLCAVFRFAVGRYLRLMQTQPGGKRSVRLTGMIVLVILVGMTPGSFSHFDQASQNVIMAMDQRLQQAASDPSLKAQFPLAEFPALQSHFGMHFVLYPRASGSIASALDVTIRYADGFAITCLVPTSDPYVQYFKQCFPGNNVALP